MGWPAPRFGHAVVSLYDPDENPENPAVVLVGGCTCSCDIHNDAWMLSVNNLEWKKVNAIFNIIPKINIQPGIDLE